jgi:hypothetical protein
MEKALGQKIGHQVVEFVKIKPEAKNLEALYLSE